MYINLNRSEELIETINDDTPLSVIKFLVNTCGKNILDSDLVNKRDLILKFLRNYNNIIDDQDLYNNTNLLKISKYVSDDQIKWTKENLINSYKHIKNFNREVNLNEITFCSKNNDNVYSYDIVMSYKLCLHNNISTNKLDDLESLKSKLLQVHQNSLNRNEIYDSILVKLGNCDKKDLITISDLLSDNRFDSKDLDFGEVKLNTNYIISKSCLNHTEAILYAAKFFNLDLSDCEYPTRELFYFNRCKLSEKTYQPTSDDLFSRNYRKNSEYYFMDKFWKSHLEVYYSPKVLQSLLSYENCEDKYELNKALNDNNFYIGWIPGCLTEKTFFHNSDIIENKIISYGNILQRENMKIFTVDEIIEYWKNNNYFKNFVNEEWIDYKVVDKLYSITRDYTSNEKMYQLSSEIKRIKKLSISNYLPVKQLLDDYLMYSDQIDLFFNSFFKVGLSMRGWSEDQQFPLSEGDTKNINMEKLNYYLEKISNLTYKFRNIPLINYSRDIFIPIRKNILEVCDRNYLLDNAKISKNIIATSYYYVKLLNNKELFDLQKFN